MPLIHAERDPDLYCPPVVQVPEGMTADEARQILADHRPWVEVTEAQRADLPTGARLRIEWANNMPTSRTLAHPDDALNPDADLIDDLARDLAEAWVRMESWGHALNVPDADFIDLARKTIERVRAA